MSERMVKDPVCGKDVDTLRARAVGIFGGVTYYFCSADCKAKFVDPRKAPRTAPIAAAGGEAEVRARPEVKPDDGVKYARTRPKREPEPPESEGSSVKVDPSPSVQAEIEATKSGGVRAWLVVLLLFTVAGVVLFFAFRK